MADHNQWSIKWNTKSGKYGLYSQLRYKEFFQEEAANFIKVTQPNWLKLQH